MLHRTKPCQANIKFSCRRPSLDSAPRGERMGRRSTATLLLDRTPTSQNNKTITQEPRRAPAAYGLAALMATKPHCKQRHASRESLDESTTVSSAPDAG